MSNKKVIAEVGLVLAEVGWLVASGATAEDYAVFGLLLVAKVTVSYLTR